MHKQRNPASLFASPLLLALACWASPVAARADGVPTRGDLPASPTAQTAEEQGAGELIKVYRWFHPGDKDWITLADGELPDSTLKAWGYQDKTLQLCAFKDSGEGRVRAIRWFHPSDKDWITLADGEISDSALKAWGYQDPKPKFFVLTHANAQTVPVYRWFHPGDKDWITLADGEISDSTLEAWGYKDRTPQFYALPASHCR